MMKKNIAALAAFFVLLMLVIAPTYGAVVRDGIEAHVYVTTKTQSRELTVPEAEVSCYADLFDFQKGVHYTIAVAEGEAVNMNAIVANNLLVKHTVEVSWIIRYKVGDGSWSVLDTSTTKGDINAQDSSVGQTETQNLLTYGVWQEGNQFHVGVHIKDYPSSDPSDSAAKAWSMWLLISDTTPTTTPPGDGNGDGTTTGAQALGILSFFKPLATALGLSMFQTIALLLGCFVILLVIATIIRRKF